ncbi:Outer membrane protein beta-barrel domain-containing protein [Nonlabens sp. Hel1_33_55]|uniref:porin family protein n=1 Tax=Nonlabens sp. Hel1_33_55 TaxID=1336802 RepID=UPI000875BAD5|nr:porin family protein [Nonlabens sp. Hel1_33_55]SCY29055.1 Outer membrane protein beta-barrel domain-containing protein [Nonlabens sp. Hel1_33_55]
MKNLLVSLLFLTSITLVAAQEQSLPYDYRTTEQTTNFSVQAGINLANLTEGQDFQNRIGMNAALLASFKFSNPKFSFTTGLSYSQLGAKRNGSFPNPADGPNIDYEATLQLDYLVVPLLVEYEVIPNYSIFLGPQVGFLIDNSEKYELVEDAFGTTGQNFELEPENIQKSYLSITLGAKAFLYSNFFIKAQYEVGLYDIFKDEQFPQDAGRTFSFDNFRHSVLTATLGYQL